MRSRFRLPDLFTPGGMASLLLVVLGLGWSDVYGETIYADIHGDTVTIWNVNASIVCGSKFRVDLQISNDTLQVNQIDTATVHARCLCYTQMSVAITGLHAGHYVVPVYRKAYASETLTLIGTTEFTIGSSSTSMAHASFQSQCSSVTLAVTEFKPLPERVTLRQNFPNPFNPSTTIRYGLANSSQVTLTVFNTLGQQVALLQNGEQEAGYHEVKFDGSGLSSGVYYYRLTAGTFVEMKKLLLVR